MATIALVWELGADLGHVTRYSLIAGELVARGHRPVMYLCDVTKLSAVIALDSPYTILQAPVCQQSPTGLQPALNFTETLFRVGFYDSEILASLITSWQHGFDLVEPEAIVFDHAPVAQLGARGLSSRKIILSNSFSVPPLPAPFPSYRFWLDEPQAAKRIQRGDAVCLQIANKALEVAELPKMNNLGELFKVDDIAICERPEFDVYGRRDNLNYLGAINDEQVGVSPRWPTGKDGPKIFAYLKSKFAHIGELLNCLSKQQANIIVYLPGVTGKQRAAFEGESLQFSNEPLKLSEVAMDCDYAICHGGTGTVNTFIDHGIPTFCIPLTVEQMMFSKRVESCHLAHVFPLEGEESLVQPLLGDFLDDTTVKDFAKSWCLEKKPLTQEARVNLACDLIENQLA